MRYALIAVAALVLLYALLSRPERVPALKPPASSTDPSSISDPREKIHAVYEMLVSGDSEPEDYDRAVDWLNQAEDWEPPASYIASYTLAILDHENGASGRVEKLARLLEEADEEHLNYMKNFLNTTRFSPDSVKIAQDLENREKLIKEYDRIFFQCRAYGPGWKFLTAVNKADEAAFDIALLEKYAVHMKAGMITQ